MQLRNAASWVIPVVLTLGCGGGTGTEGASSGASSGPVVGDDLDKSVVTSIPDGDAKGTAFSGEYSVSIYTAECEGDCGPVDSGAFAVSFCDVGEDDSEELVVTQTDGHLRIDADDPVSRLEGGIEADGSFDVGGYGTEQGGNVEITARVTGTLDAQSRTLTGAARARSVGDVNGDSVDCHGDYEITPD